MPAMQMSPAGIGVTDDEVPVCMTVPGFIEMASLIKVWCSSSRSFPVAPWSPTSYSVRGA